MSGTVVDVLCCDYFRFSAWRVEVEREKMNKRLKRIFVCLKIDMICSLKYKYKSLISSVVQSTGLVNQRSGVRFSDEASQATCTTSCY